MTLKRYFPRRPGRRLVAAVLLAFLAPACAGEEKRAEAPQPATAPEPAPEPARPPTEPPALQRTTIRVLDGDTAKPVRGARVRFAGGSVRTGVNGTAELGLARERAKVVVSARAYASRTYRLSFRHRLAHSVQVWRRNLQWPLYGANAARTQAHPGIDLRPPFKLVWSRRMRGLLEFPAVIWEGVGYVNNMNGLLTAFATEDGHVLWRKRIGTRMASSPAVDPESGSLVTTSMSPGYVKVVSMATGRVRWRYHIGRAEPSPVIRGRLAYVAAANGNVYALDLERRRARWIFRGGTKITSSPALVGNRLYVGDYAGRVFALDARTGRRIWTGSAGSRVYGTVAVAGGRVFAPSVFSGLSALSARTGRRLWRVPSGAYLYSSPAAFRGRVYFGTYGGRVYCASQRSGRILWSRPAGGRVSGAVQVVAGVVYAASLENRTTGWDWRTGRTLWTFPHGKYVPVSGNGSRLLFHAVARVFAVRPKRG